MDREGYAKTGLFQGIIVESLPVEREEKKTQKLSVSTARM